MVLLHQFSKRLAPVAQEAFGPVRAAYHNSGKRRHPRPQGVATARLEFFFHIAGPVLATCFVTVYHNVRYDLSESIVAGLLIHGEIIVIIVQNRGSVEFVHLQSRSLRGCRSIDLSRKAPSKTEYLPPAFRSVPVQFSVAAVPADVDNSVFRNSVIDRWGRVVVPYGSGDVESCLFGIYFHPARSIDSYLGAFQTGPVRGRISEMSGCSRPDIETELLCNGIGQNVRQ